MGNHSTVPMDDQHLSILLQGCAAAYLIGMMGVRPRHIIDHRLSGFLWFFFFPSLLSFCLLSSSPWQLQSAAFIINYKCWQSSLAVINITFSKLIKVTLTINETIWCTVSVTFSVSVDKHLFEDVIRSLTEVKVPKQFKYDPWQVCPDLQSAMYHQ